MLSTPRRLVLTGALVATLAVPIPAAAQEAPPDFPALSQDPPPGLASTPEPTATPTATAEPTVTATPVATPSAGPRLPDTGTDAASVALGGLSLLLLGASLRIQLHLRDGRA